MASQNEVSGRASKGSSTRKGQTIDLDSIMMGIEEYLNDNESEQEQKSDGDDDENDRSKEESGRTKDDNVDNYNNDEVAGSSKGVTANSLDSEQRKESRNIDDRHSKNEVGDGNNINHLDSDGMQPLERDSVAAIQEDRVDGEAQVSKQSQVPKGEESKLFETAGVQSIQQDILTAEVGKTVGQLGWDESSDREDDDKVTKKPGPTKHVEERERELEVIDDIEGKDGQDRETRSQVAPPIDQNKGIKEGQHAESSRAGALGDIVEQTEVVEKESQREEVPTKAEEFGGIAEQVKVIDQQEDVSTEPKHHEQTENVQESSSGDEAAVVKSIESTDRVDEPEKLGTKAETAQNIGDSVVTEEQAIKVESAGSINEATNNASKKDDQSAVALESSGDMARQIDDIEGLTTKAGPIEDAVKESKGDGGEEAFTAGGLADHELKDKAGNEITGEVSETANDAEESGHTSPQSGLVETESEQKGGREEASAETASIAQKLKGEDDNKITGNVSEAAKDTEEGEHSFPQSGLVEAEGEQKGGRQEASTKTAPIAQKLKGEDNNEVTGNVSEAAKDTGESEHTPLQSEVVEAEGEQEGRRGEASTETAPIARTLEGEGGSKITGNVSEAAKDTEEGSSPQSGIVEAEGEQKGGREEASTETAPIAQKLKGEGGDEITEGISEAAKDAEESEHTPPQGELANTESERGETSTETAPITRNLEGEDGTEITGNVSEAAKDTEEGEHAPPQSEVVEAEGEEEGRREEASTETAPIAQKPEGEDNNEVTGSVSETAKDAEKSGHTPPQSGLVEAEGEQKGELGETSTETAPIALGDEDSNEITENVSEAAKDTEESEHTPPQGILVKKEGGNGETLAETESGEQKPELVGDVEQSHHGDETFKAAIEPTKQVETGDGQDKPLTEVERSEDISEPTNGEKVAKETELEPQDEEKEDEKCGESSVEQSKNVEANHQRDETISEAVSDKPNSALTEDDEEGARSGKKVAGDATGVAQEMEEEKSEDSPTKIESAGDIVEQSEDVEKSTTEPHGEVTETAERDNELEELAVEADPLKDIAETEAITEEKTQLGEASKEAGPIAETLCEDEEVKEEDEGSGRPATGVETTENTEHEASATVGPAEKEAEPVKRVDSIEQGTGETELLGQRVQGEEATANLESVKVGAEEGDGQNVSPIANSSQNVDYSLEPTDDNNAGDDVVPGPTTEGPNKVPDGGQVQADLPINSNSDKPASILPHADTQDAEAAYSDISVDPLDQASTKPEQDTNREVSAITAPEDAVADNSGSTGQDKKESSTYNVQIGEGPETQSNGDHKSAQADDEKVDKNIQEGTENAENICQTDSRKPEQSISSTSFDAETEAILRGLDNPQELLKELELDRRTEPVYVFTSLAGGGFHIIPRTNRLATILQANRIQFTYRDLGTDPQARNLWKAHAHGKQLPGLVRGSDVVGNWQDVDEANEEYRLDELLYGT